MSAVARGAVSAELCSRPLFKKIVLFALPLILTSVLQLLYTAADLMIVGRWTGETAMSAVGSTGALINLVTNLFLGLSVGALAVVARYVGAKDALRVEQSAHTAIVVSLIGGVIVGAFGFFASRILLRWMDTPSEILGQSALYLRIYFCGMPFNLLYNFGASILRACGDTRRPLVILAAAGVANILLDIFTVTVLDMGVAGVGIATLAAQVVSAVGVVLVLMRRKDAAKFCWRKMRIHRAALVDILRIGLPAGLQGTVFSLSNVIIQSSINGFGKTVVAANASACNIEGFVYVSMNSVAQSCLTVAGQNYGARKAENIDLALAQCLVLVTAVGIVLGWAACLAARPLLRLYGCTEEALSYGAERLYVVCGTYAICGMMDTMVGVLRGIGSSTAPMIVSIVGICGLRIVWVYTVFRAVHTPLMLYISYTVSWDVTLFVHLLFYLARRRKVRREIAALDAVRAQEREENISAQASEEIVSGDADTQEEPRAIERKEQGEIV